jgi:tetratricopeptide (TPR) repeat protein
MINTLILGLAALPTGTPPPVLPLLLSPTLEAALPVPEDDFEKELEAAGEDVGKLLELARAWKEAGKRKESKSAFERVLEVDAENEEAHKALRHHSYDGKWFKSYSALSKYRRAEAKKKAEEGLSRHGDEWVSTADLPYLRLGWIKGEDGKWRRPRDLARAANDEKMLEAGCQLRTEDSSWVDPADFDKWREGLWKCDDEWVTTEKANEYHSQIGQWWVSRGEHFQVLSTCNVDTLRWAQWHADQAYADLVRIYGVEPTTHPPIVVLSDMTEFNTFAAGDQATQQPPAEASGFSSLHFAYFADAWYGGTQEQPQFLGTGVAYWDAGDENFAPFGKLSVRHAAGLSYLEATRPSVITVSEAVAGGAPPDLEAFWAEKGVPRWMIYGAASYVERYYEDPEAGDPLQTRAWAISNLASKGKFDKLEDIFEFSLSLDDIDGSTKMIHEAGLVICFILDGGCEAVTEKHEALKATLKSGEGTEDAVEALQKTLKKNQRKFEKFAGL